MMQRAKMADLPAIATLFRQVRRTALPYLPELHTPEQDLDFFRRVAAEREVWCAGAHGIEGFIAFGDGWIDHLYVHPDRQGLGHGTGLLGLAQEHHERLQLWAFQRNVQAIRFYESRGFRIVERTDGRRNEEAEPDARLVWGRL